MPCFLISMVLVDVRVKQAWEKEHEAIVENFSVMGDKWHGCNSTGTMVVLGSRDRCNVLITT